MSNQKTYRPTTGRDSMWSRGVSKTTLRLAAVVIMIGSLIIGGSGDDDDGGFNDAELATLSGRTFNFPDASVLNSAFASTSTATLVFGTASTTAVPFTLTVGGVTVTGSATLGTPLNCPTEVEITIGDSTFPTATDLCEVDVTVDDGVDSDIVQFMNDSTGATSDFAFVGSDTGSTGSTGG